MKQNNVKKIFSEGRTHTVFTVYDVIVLRVMYFTVFRRVIENNLLHCYISKTIVNRLTV